MAKVAARRSAGGKRATSGKKQGVASSRARDEFSELINRVAYGKETILIHRRKKPVAAIIPVYGPEFLEMIEDEIDIREARKARAEKGRNVTLEEMKRRYGL